MPKEDWIDDKFLYEGFWREKVGDGLPMPKARDKPWKGQSKFLASLATIEAHANVNMFLGFSRCRVCNCINGSREYKFGGWKWPQGFMHYVKDHNVKPTPKFCEFVSLHSGLIDS